MANVVVRLKAPPLKGAGGGGGGGVNPSSLE